MAKRKLRQDEIKMDLTPMIDCIFQLIIFFLLVSRITAEITNELITVPPTLTARKIEVPIDWRKEKVQVWGKTQNEQPGETAIFWVQIGNEKFASHAKDDFEPYQQLRDRLDRLYIQADKYDDPKNPVLKLPKVVIELRADANTEYRVVQEVQQILCDSINPFDEMKPKAHADFSQAKPFVHIHFTTRKPGE